MPKRLPTEKRLQILQRDFDALDASDMAYLEKAKRNANDLDADSFRDSHPTTFHTLNFGDLP
jgi:hypothetical protein